jgi:hypothetical protein
VRSREHGHVPVGNSSRWGLAFWIELLVESDGQEGIRKGASTLALRRCGFFLN